MLARSSLFARFAASAAALAASISSSVRLRSVMSSAIPTIRRKLWIDGVDPSISPVVKLQTGPSRNFLVSRADINHCRRVWLHNKKHFTDILHQLAEHFCTLLQSVLCSFPLGDVNEGYYRTN